MDPSPPKDARTLLIEKIELFERELVITANPELKHEMRVRLDDARDQLAELSLSAAQREQLQPRKPARYRPVNRRRLKTGSGLSLWQRLTFGWWSRQRRAECAWRATGAFDRNEIARLWEDTQGVMPIPLRIDAEETTWNAKKWLSNALQSNREDNRFYLLLGETGTGKSTLLANVFLELALRSSRQYCLLLRLDDTFDPAALEVADAEQTVLLIDGIDEHPRALADPDAFLTELETATRNFARVVISCRTQFFRDRLGERTRTATRPANDYRRLEVQLLEQKMLAEQIGKRFSPLSDRERYRTALSIVGAAGQLFNRPLLLPFLESLVAQRDELVFINAAEPRVTAYEVYEFAIGQWLEREAEKLPPARDAAVFKTTLFDAMLELARRFYLRESDRLAASLYFTDLEPLEELYEEVLRRDELRVKSLLHRDEQGNFRFAHRTFKEYCYALLLFRGRLPEADFPFARYPDTARFLREMAVVEYCRANPLAAKDAAAVRVVLSESAGRGIVFSLFGAAGLRTEIPVFDGFHWLFGAALERSAWDHAYTALAWRLLDQEQALLPIAILRDVAETYGLGTGDLFQFPVFRPTPTGGAFLHRSFAEFLLIRQLLAEETVEELRTAYAEFPFAKLRFGAAFRDELRWLELAISDRFPTIRMDFVPTSAEIRAMDTGTLFQKMERESQIGPTDYFRYRALLRRNPGLAVRYPEVAESETIQQALNNWPGAERIERLDLGYNRLAGAVDLRSFSALRSLAAAGNPDWDWEASPLPAKLEELTLPGESPSTLGAFAQFHRKVLPQFTAHPSDLLPEMVPVAGGRFWMGDEESDQTDEEPRHLVGVSDFALGKYPVTVRQFAAFVAATGYRTLAEREGWAWGTRKITMPDGRRFYRETPMTQCHWRYDPFGEQYLTADLDCPVIFVSWEDAVMYCSWLSERTGKSYRLPTEAEWEYAAIGGQSDASRDEEGNVIREFEYAGSDDLDEVAWHFHGMERSSTRPVGTKAPNQLGLFDMSGNVFEWCADWYGSEYYAVSEAVVVDPPGPESGAHRVLRGGGWFVDAVGCRPAFATPRARTALRLCGLSRGAGSAVLTGRTLLLGREGLPATGVGWRRSKPPRRRAWVAPISGIFSGRKPPIFPKSLSCVQWLPAMEAHRVLRGGSWNDDAVDCRTANRNANEPRRRNANVGFRVARAPQLNERAGWPSLNRWDTRSRTLAVRDEKGLRPSGKGMLVGSDSNVFPFRLSAFIGTTRLTT